MATQELNELVFAEELPLAFRYDHASRDFIVNQTVVPLDAFEAFTGFWDIDHNTDMTLEQFMSEVPVAVHASANPMMLPRFYNWLLAANRQTEFNDTKRVMFEVYKAVSQVPDLEFDRLTGPFGFDVVLYRPGHPALSVIGNCACLGVDPGGDLYDEQDWDEGFASYSFHNIDTKPQAVSLYAGLGHLASLAAS